MADLTTSSSFLRINNITLKVPPKNISIVKQDYNASVSTLRSQISTHVKSGRRSVGIIVETYFADGHNARSGEEIDGKTWINEQLAPLLIQVRKCPFVSIENEKIRKEILSDPERREAEGMIHANMAAVVKNITVETKAREPGVYHVRFFMEWFNYLPFSDKFAYKEVSVNGAVSEVDTPGNQFDAFYKSGTTREVGNLSALVNRLDPQTPDRKEDDLEIIYKEYRRIDLESLDFSKDLDRLIGLDLDKSEEVPTPLRSNLSNYDNAVQTLRDGGWQFLDDFEASTNEPGRVIYRYRKFTIPAIDPSAQLESGRLIVESAGSTLDTKTVSIPLLGHTIPTAQFLGATDGSLVISLFANAELESGLTDGDAIGTSSQLSVLNSIIELVNINAVKYRRVAKNDSVFIKHPMARLLKYKKYDETRLEVVNDATSELEVFDANDYLACIVQGTESHTVEGLPYCSRFNLRLTENYKTKEGIANKAEKKPSGRVHDATKNILRTLIDKYDIQPRKDKVATTGRDKTKKGKDSVIQKVTEVGDRHVDIDANRKGVPANEPDFAIAQRLAQYLDASIAIKDFEDSKDVLDDPDFMERTNSEVDASYTEAVSVRSPSLKGLPEEDLNRLKAMDNQDDFVKEANRIRGKLRVRGGLSNRTPLSAERVNGIAWDMLRILSKKDGDSSTLKEYQDSLEEFKSFNLVSDESSYPDMMLPDNKMQPDFFFYNPSDVGGNTHKNKLIDKVFKRYQDNAEQFAKEVANVEAPTVLSSEFRPSPGPPVPALNLISIGSDKKRKEEAPTDKGFAQSPLDEDVQFENIKAAIDNFTDKTYTMRRSMPTFRLFVKEDDLGSFSDIDKDRLRKKGKKNLWRNFSEFHDINSVADIRLVKDKKNPADLLVVRITNTREDLVNKSYEDLTSKLERKFSSLQKTKPKIGSTSGKENKADLNELDGVMLKEGARIELRVGYEGNPNNLSVEFSGRISQIGGGDVVEIICQGDGIELMQELKGVGVADEYTWSSNTQNIISELLHNSPEVKNFGTINAKTYLGDIGLFWKGAGGRTAVENVFAPSLFNSWDNFGDKSLKWTSRGAGAGLLFGPVGGLIGSIVGGAIGIGAGVKDAFFKFFKGSKFTVYEQTIWDTLQELALRHPGIVCDIVPFDRRSTIFFGYPDQLYFNRGPTFKEAIAMDGDDLESSFGGLIERNAQEAFMAKNKLSSMNKRFSKRELRRRATLAKEGQDEDTINAVIFDSDGQKARYIDQEGGEIRPVKYLKDSDMGMHLMKQYRNYHMITSEHDIVDNSMIVNSDGVFNSVQVVHPKSSGDGNYDGSEGFSGYEATDEIKGDDDLNRDYIKRQTLVFHNAHKDLEEIDLPERYAVSSLCRSLNDVYKGKITILGRPGIKPHDIVFVYDTYNNIFGPVEVGSVIHTISYDTGWITEIIPQMIVTPTTSTSVLHINAIQRLITSFYLKNMKLFYSGPIFASTGELDNDLAVDTLGQEIAQSSLAHGLPEGLAIGATSIQAARTGKDIARSRKWGRVIKGASKTKALNLLAAGGKLAFARTAGASLPILGDLLVDYVGGFYTNWSKYRQPITFIPVTRNGKPWYTGLYGLNNNTETEAVKGVATDFMKKADFYVDYMKKEFDEIFD